MVIRRRSSFYGEGESKRKKKKGKNRKEREREKSRCNSVTRPARTYERARKRSHVSVRAGQSSVRNANDYTSRPKIRVKKKQGREWRKREREREKRGKNKKKNNAGKGWQVEKRELGN